MTRQFDKDIRLMKNMGVGTDFFEEWTDHNDSYSALFTSKDHQS